MEKIKQTFYQQQERKFRKTFHGIGNINVRYAETMLPSIIREINNIYQHHSLENAIMKGYTYESALTETFPVIYGRHLDLQKCCSDK